MAALTVHVSTTAGVAFTTATPAGGGDTFTNTGAELLYVANANGSSINVTFTVTGRMGRSGEPGANTTRVEAVPNGETQFFGPFDPAAFSGSVAVLCSATTGVTVGVVRCQFP
jgi:hypothetical protein